MAAAEVSKAIRMKGVEAPSVDKTFVTIDKNDVRIGKVDEAGLPLVYDKDLIQKYWETQGGALQERWSQFVRLSVPFLTKVAALGIQGGAEALQENGATLARDARKIFEKLGPTYVKMGQMMSVRPDVLPQAALDELAILQDSVPPFDTKIAIDQIESELGCPLGEVFSEISDSPVAAASLAQVYKAKLVSTGEYVAVKVQRPGVQELVSKDLYVLRRAAEVYQGLIDRFAPQQRTDYISLLNEWAVGFYTELDFLNEGRSQLRVKELLQQEGKTGVYVPDVKLEYSTRRVLVSEWIDGVKLSDCSPEEIRELIPLAQEVFLTQLLQVGFFHSDPHPGNLMKLNDTSKGKIALLDFGLMATLSQEDMDTMVSSIIHLANKDYAALVDDFIELKILPGDCDRAKVIPLMDKALSPYIKGGGAKQYEQELKKIYGFDGSVGSAAGGFQQMTGDMLTVLNDIPFSIPPYFALLGRAVVTLEGIALTGNPNYQLVMEAYPFVARKLLSEDRPEIQKALQEVLYGAGTGDGGTIRADRLAVIVNSAMGRVVQGSGAFVDFDTVPTDGVSLGDALAYILTPGGASLRNLITDEAFNVADLVLRQAARKSFTRIINSLPQPPTFLPFLPKPGDAPIPVLLPTPSGQPVPVVAEPNKLLEALAPKLDREEELYVISLTDLAARTLGDDSAKILSGDAILEPQSTARLLLRVLATGQAPGANTPEAAQAARNLRQALGLDSEGEDLDGNLSDLTAAGQRAERRRPDGLAGDCHGPGGQAVEQANRPPGTVPCIDRRALPFHPALSLLSNGKA
eukprot:jgi/Tetstr1/450135/TSEL_037177.t1